MLFKFKFQILTFQTEKHFLNAKAKRFYATLYYITKTAETGMCYKSTTVESRLSEPQLSKTLH